MKNFYKSIFKYLSTKRKELIFVSSIFLISLIVGLIEPNFFREFQDLIINSILNETKNKTWLQLIQFIILNNVKASAIAVFAGFFFFVFPLAIIILNGYLVGAVASRALSDLSIFEVLVKIIPHGVFEIPAILISYSLAITLSIVWFKKQKIKSFKYEFKNSLKVFFAIIIPLLIIAGFIEASLIFFN